MNATAGTAAALILAIDKLLERADVSGWPEAERVVEALGWTGTDEMPDGDWVRDALAGRIQ